mmetsp:Transcript_68061/g.197210  ORF Transcript_68061/g.197210 Transcript_68061/m.197210 type:complete len:235 (-) Transcript_68061:103-807(-)
MAVHGSGGRSLRGLHRSRGHLLLRARIVVHGHGDAASRQRVGAGPRGGLTPVHPGERAPPRRASDAVPAGVEGFGGGLLECLGGGPPIRARVHKAVGGHRGNLPGGADRGAEAAVLHACVIGRQAHSSPKQRFSPIWSHRCPPQGQECRCSPFQRTHLCGNASLALRSTRSRRAGVAALLCAFATWGSREKPRCFLAPAASMTWPRARRDRQANDHVRHLALSGSCDYSEGAKL